jgi:hypothetical protein
VESRVATTRVESRVATTRAVGGVGPSFMNSTAALIEGVSLVFLVFFLILQSHYLHLALYSFSSLAASFELAEQVKP